jgi:hypothetical protein
VNWSRLLPVRLVKCDHCGETKPAFNLYWLAVVVIVAVALLELWS